SAATRYYREVERAAQELLVTSSRSADLYYSPTKDAVAQWQVAEDGLPEEEEGKVCPLCLGSRLRPEALAVKIHGLNIAEVMAHSVGKSAELFGSWKFGPQESMVAGPILKEIREKLGFLTRVGLDYVTLDRKISTLSSGEAQRVR